MTTSPSTPSATVSLSALRERARALEATPQDIDALLAAMARPAISEEPVRSRADVLHLLIEDPVLGGLRGSDGRRVDETAVQALVALGEPYAAELSADGQKLLQNAPPLPAPDDEDEEDEEERPEDGRWRLLLGPFLVACGLIETRVAWVWLSQVHWPALFWPCLALSGLTVMGPGLLLMLRPTERSPGLYTTIRSRLLYPSMLLLLVSATVSIGLSSMGGSRQYGRLGAAMMAGLVIRFFVLLSLNKAVNEAPPSPGT
jgi:hypothetical protein